MQKAEKVGPISTFFWENTLIGKLGKPFAVASLTDAGVSG
jgi:hypothetical protein